jgi:hypothetical protein
VADFLISDNDKNNGGFMKFIFTSILVLATFVLSIGQGHHHHYHNSRRPVNAGVYHRANVKVIIAPPPVKYVPVRVCPPPAPQVCHDGFHYSGCTCKRPFTTYDFERFYGNTSSLCGDYQRISFIKNNLNYNLVNTTQADQLVRLINDEGSRLDLAYNLFDYTTDKLNYGALSYNFSPYYRGRFNEFLLRNNINCTHDDFNNRGCNNNSGYNSKGGYYNNDNNQNQNQNGGNYSYQNNYTSNNHNHTNINLMSESDLASLKNAVNSQSFTAEKLTVMKQGVNGRMITSAQAAELIKLHTFESEKLEAAKYLYDYTTDKENYYQVNSVFSFKSSVNELDTFLAKK